MTLRSTQRLKGAVAAAFAGLTLASCGGGGGGGGSAPVSPPPPPPPPPVNAAPTAQATASPTAPQEGQPFTLNASASTDPEGAALTYSWTQLSGPPVPLTAPNQAVLQLAAAEVTEDTGAVFRVSVSDGTNTSSTDVSVTFVNIAQAPSIPFPYELLVTTTLNERPIIWSGVGLYDAILGTETVEGGPVTFHRVNGRLENDTFVASISSAIEGVFEQPLSVYSTGMLYRTMFQLAILEEKSNRFRIFGPLSGDDAPLEEFPERILLPAPCFLGASAAVEPFTYAFGKRNGGISRYPLTIPAPGQSETPPIITVAPTQSLCGFFVTRMASNGQPLAHSSYRRLEDIVAYNATTSSIDHYTQYPDMLTGASGEQVEYRLASSTPILLNSTVQLDFVKASIVTAPFGYPSLALLFSDGQHDGNHRLVIAGIQRDFTLTQSVHSWEFGAPAEILQLDATPEFGAEIVVLSKTSPQAIVFESTDPNGAWTALRGPFFMEIGLGAAAAGGIPYQWYEDFGLVILYPDKRQVKVFRPLPAVP